MTLKEKIKVMEHFEKGGEIENKTRTQMEDRWGKCPYPVWNWDSFDYRIKEEEKPLLFEWWYKFAERVSITNRLMTENDAVEWFAGGNMHYGKTGRWFNPDTKEFGGQYDTKRRI